VKASSHVVLERVTVSQCGTNGIQLNGNVMDVAVQNSAVTDVGGEGIAAGSSDNVTDVFIQNNYINNTGLVILGQPGGIRMQGQANISIRHNTIGFCPYAAVMVGWQTGWDAATGGPPATPVVTVESVLWFIQSLLLFCFCV
jgi:hypothetical protein